MGDAMWFRAHGGITHFPIALIVVSVLFDLVAFGVKREPYSRELHAAGVYALMVAALASLPGLAKG